MLRRTAKQPLDHYLSSKLDTKLENDSKVVFCFLFFRHLDTQIAKCVSHDRSNCRFDCVDLSNPR